MTWEMQLSFAIQATRAVNYLHIFINTHPPQDIKSLNFLIHDKSTLLLTDFGLAKPKEFVTSNT
jgi:serine/threonine protein kinase